ncbi:MAG: S1C family serine protease [Planctomycetota bacterium]|jgi:S1-C subfamily serine protease
MRTLALLLALAAPLLAQPDMDKLRASVVQVSIVTQSEDYSRPWQRPRPRRSGGSAFYIGDKMLMTNAHVVSDAKVLRVKRADRVKWYEAHAVFAGHDCDLAVITVDDETFWEGMQPLRIGNRPAMQSTVSTVGYPMGGNKLSITKGVVSRIEMQDYSHSGADVHLAIQIDAPINPGNSGGPVLQDGKVAGVAFQLQFFAQSLGYMIPPSVMRHFLEDIQDGTYDGYPELGVYTANLQNDTLRAYLGVPEGKAGVLVLKPMPYASAVGQLRRNDVLHEIDGIPIENDGTIKVNGEFFEFTHVVESKQIGDTVTLTVRRDGKVIEVPIKLKKWDVRMSPAIAYDERPEYLVYGGYLFVPVATNYLFRARSSDELTYYYRQYYRIVAKEGKTREQLVVLSRVLPHASTRYRAYRNAIVALVNGVEPRDFKHFVELVETCKGNLVKVDFEGVNVAPLILDKAKIAEVHEKICKRFGVTEDRYVKGD